MRKFGIALVVLIVLATAPPAYATTYKLDAAHTTVGFKIRHLFSKTQGRFNEFEGTFVYEQGNPDAWTVNATIQTASIDTNKDARDKHLRSDDFFDVEQFPTMTFRSTETTEATDTSAKVHGLLTLHGVERPVVLDLEIHGEAKDPWGNQLSGFTASTMINRKDFGLTWNETLETGQLLVGEEVWITIEVEGIAVE